MLAHIHSQFFLVGIVYDRGHVLDQKLAFDKAYLEKPEETKDYYETEGYYWGDSKEVRIDTPTRYYMNENKSLDAEKVYDENIDSTYVKVRVKNGKMVIVGVFVNDVLIDTIDYEKNK